MITEPYEPSSTSRPPLSTLAVWGLGYIGATTALALLECGFDVVAVDPSQHRREEVSDHALVLNSAHHLTIDFRELIRTRRLTLASEPSELVAHQPTAHFFCFPTERDGLPYSEHLSGALKWVGAFTPDALLIIESTIAPRWIDDLGLRTRNVAIAPRRDWFHSPDHTLATLTRVCAATNEGVQSRANELLSQISRSIVWSSDLVATAASKAFENSLWFVLFSLVNELSANLDGVDFLEVLRLSETNWRTPFKFEPAYRVGGYCLPLSSEYLASLLVTTSAEQSASHVLAAAKAANNATADVIHRAVVDSVGDNDGAVLILGISYRPGIKVPTYSAGSTLARMCASSGLRVLVHDPLFDGEQLRTLTGCVPVDLKTGLDEASCVVACTAHSTYAELRHMSELPENVKVVFDAVGAFDHRIADGGKVRYQRLGVNGPAQRTSGRE